MIGGSATVTVSEVGWTLRIPGRPGEPSGDGRTLALTRHEPLGSAMSVSESTNIQDLFDQLKGWPSSDRLRLARMILATLEPGTPTGSPRPDSLRGILGLLKSDEPPPTDQECQAILEEELTKKHLS